METPLGKPFLKTPLSVTLKTRQSYSWFELGLVICAIVLIYFFMIRPKQATITVARDNLKTLQEQYNSLQASIDKLNKLSEDLDAHKKDIKDIDEALPLKAMTIRLQMLLQDTVISSGMTLASLGVGSDGGAIVSGDKPALAHPYEAKRSLKTIASTLSVTGSIAQFEDLLKKLQTSARLMDISAFSVAPGKDGLLQFNMLLTSYYYAP